MSALCVAARTLKMVAVSFALRSLLVSANMPKTQSSIEIEAVNLFMHQTRDLYYLET